MTLPWSFPRWIAHRGAGKQAPENTLAAFREGARCGFRAFECDAKLSADGVPFLLHDATLERTTSGRGEAGSLTWQALCELDAGAWLDPRFAGEPLPALADILLFCRVGGHALNIEIKPGPGADAPTGEAVARLVQAQWPDAATNGRLLLSSFNPDALAAAATAVPALPRALLVDAPRLHHLPLADDLHCVAVVAHHPLIDAAFVAAQQAAGRRVLSYTVNDEAVARRLLAAGVDGLITDRMDGLHTQL